MAKNGRVSVEIFGQTYTLVGNQSEDSLIRLADFVDEQMRRVQNQNPRLSLTQIAVLACVNIADQYFQLRDEYREVAAAVRNSDPS
ncbi:MAG: cell division protein ZapA [Firmicutes bacterium]|nr:cell division protein ZapA [Bacillota bacterium]